MNRPHGAGAEAAEIRAQEEVRTQEDQDRTDSPGGEDRIREALDTAAAVAEETGGLYCWVSSGPW